MLDKAELGFRRDYWAHVQACLVRFHKLPRKAAEELVGSYLKRFPISSEDPVIEAIYHYEAFQLACKMTKNKLTVKDFVDEYQEILATSSIPAKTSKHGLPKLAPETIRKNRVTAGSAKRRPSSKYAAKKPAGQKTTSVKAGDKKTLPKKLSTKKAAKSGTKKSPSRKAATRKATTKRTPSRKKK